MSVDPYQVRAFKTATSFTYLLLTLASGIPAVTQAEMLDRWPPLAGEDPLHVRPAVLDKGVILPGDTQITPCHPDAAIPAVLDLASAVDLALCNNPQLQLTWAGIKLQSAAAGQARSAFLPTLSATANRLRTDTRYPDGDRDATLVNGNAVNAALSWRLYDFGAREANRQAADQLLLAALASHDANLQKILTNVIQAYFDVQSARAALAAKIDSQQIAQNTLASAMRREAVGAVSKGDTLQATTALARASLERHRADGNDRKATSVLVYAMGLPPTVDIHMAEETAVTGHLPEIEKMLVLQGQGLQDELRQAQQAHPAIQAAREQWRAAQSKVTASRAEGMPTVDFSGNYYQNAYPGQGLSATRSRINTIGIAITIPIFDGYSRHYQIQQARAQAEQRQEELADTQNSILMEVVKAHADALSSTENLRASEDLLVAATQALAVSQRKYDKGATDILEILTTQASLADAKQERIRCLAEWRSARLRLIASVGLLGMQSVRGGVAY